MTLYADDLNAIRGYVATRVWFLYYTKDGEENSLHLSVVNVPVVGDVVEVETGGTRYVFEVQGRRHTFLEGGSCVVAMYQRVTLICRCTEKEKLARVPR